MRRGLHPLLVDVQRAGSFGDIFREGAEMDAFMRCSLGQSRLTGKLMRKRVSLFHAPRVTFGGFRQFVAPGERLQSLGDTRAVRGLKQNL